MAGKIETPYDELTYTLTGLAMAVHSELGPGLTEEIYKKALMVLMDEKQLAYEREFPITVLFRGQNVGLFRLDFVIAHTVIVEAKSVSMLSPIHEQQTLTYLAASGLPVALLINFGAGSLQHKRLLPSKRVQLHHQKDK
jgi:GxxExxY protein